MKVYESYGFFYRREVLEERVIRSLMMFYCCNESFHEAWAAGTLTPRSSLLQQHRPPGPLTAKH